MDDLQLVRSYLQTIEKELLAGNATEHTHRTALKTLLERIVSGVVATNEPRRIECGAPDFIITKDSATMGYIEAKDVGKSLDEAEKSEQLQRYLGSLTNLILTDYLEFRWYVDGECSLWKRPAGKTDCLARHDEHKLQSALYEDFERFSKAIDQITERVDRFQGIIFLVLAIIIAAMTVIAMFGVFGRFEDSDCLSWASIGVAGIAVVMAFIALLKSFTKKK